MAPGREQRRCPQLSAPTRSGTASTPASCSQRSTRSRPSPSSAASSSASRTAGSPARTTRGRSASSTGRGQEDASRAEAFEVDAGEPAVLSAQRGRTPRRSCSPRSPRCLTLSLVYVAAARKVKLTRGQLDARGRHRRAGRARALDDEVRNGFEHIRVSFRVEGRRARGEAAGARRAGQQRSAVFDMVTEASPCRWRPMRSDVVAEAGDRSGRRHATPQEDTTMTIELHASTAAGRRLVALAERLADDSVRRCGRARPRRSVPVREHRRRSRAADTSSPRSRASSAASA